jgi:hypothetical protein
MRVPFKGTLSTSSRAQAQRERNQEMDETDLALKKCKDGDRQAKSKLIKSLKSKGLDSDQPAVEREMELLAEKRFREKSSGKLSQLFITTLY